MINLYLRFYFYNVPCIGSKIELSKQWKTVITNGDVVLWFKTVDNKWLKEDDIIVEEVQEYLNECSNS